MKKHFQLFLFLVTTLALFALPAISYAQLPPPGTVTITNITTNSVTLQWTPVPGAAIYKISMHDDTWNQPLPDAYTTATSFTYNGLQDGHDYTTGISTSANLPPNDQYGEENSLTFTTEVIIVDIFVQNTMDCELQTLLPGSNNTYVIPLIPANPGEQTVNVQLMRVSHDGGEPASNSLDFILWANCDKQVDFYQVTPSGEAGVTRHPQGAGEVSVVSFSLTGNNVTPYFRIKNPQFIISGSTPLTTVEIEPLISGFTCQMCSDTGRNNDCSVQENSRPVPSSRPEPGRLLVSPNPSVHSFQVQYTLSTDSPVSLLLLDLSGKPVRTIQSAEALPAGSYSTSVHITDLPPGLYTLMLQTAGGRQAVKVVKQ